MFGDDEFNRKCRFVGIEVDWSMDKHDDIRILFDGTGFTQVGKSRSAVLFAALFDLSIELRECDDGHFEFFGESFESTREGGYFLFTVGIAMEVGSDHELQVIDDDELYMVFGDESAHFSFEFGKGKRRCVVDDDRGAPLFDSFGIGKEVALYSGIELFFGTACYLFFAHFEGEDSDGHIGSDSHSECEGGFADTGSGGNDDEVGGLPAAVGEVIKELETGGNGRVNK